MWQIPAKTTSNPTFAALVPESVIDEYDGPRLFTVRSIDQSLFLAYQCAEDDERERFLLVPADYSMISAITENRLPIRDALTRSRRAWIVDYTREGTITQSEEVDPETLPETAMPRPGARLNPGPEALLRIRMIGEELTSEHVPASVVRRTVDAATGAVKALAAHALSLLPSAGRPAEQFRRYYDLPAVAFGFRSFEITFGMPGPRTQPELHEQEALERIQELLSRGLDWAQGDTELARSTPEWSAIVEALAKLAPPRSGVVEAVEVSGILAGEDKAPVRLTRFASNVLARRASSSYRNGGYARMMDLYANLIKTSVLSFSETAELIIF